MTFFEYFFLILLCIPISIFSYEEEVIVHENGNYYYAKKNDVELKFKKNLKNKIKNNNYQRRMYESCEELSKDEPRYFSDSQLFNCKVDFDDLNFFGRWKKPSVERHGHASLPPKKHVSQTQKNNTAQAKNKKIEKKYMKIEPKDKKTEENTLRKELKNKIAVIKKEKAIKKSNIKRYNLGMNSSYDEGFYIEMRTSIFFYYEIFFTETLYLGGRFGFASLEDSLELNIKPYIGFNPLYNKSNFNLGLNIGVLISPELRDGFIMFVDAYIGLRVSDLVTINVEYGTNNHIGLSLGFLF